MQFKKITNLDLNNKVVFIRTDMNVPISDNVITDDTRIKAAIPTIKYAMTHNAKVIIATHFGRPTEGKCTTENSVLPIVKRLSKLLNTPISIVKDLTTPIDFADTQIVMLENVRCNVGEKANLDSLGEQYASLCDIFVHDAFATAHRSEASTDKIGKYAKEVCAGLLMTDELQALSKVTVSPKAPVVAIVGGSKVSTKLPILTNLASQVDYLIVGGGILNTFLLASGVDTANSLVETDLVDDAKKVMQLMKDRKKDILLPQDVVVATSFEDTAKATIKDVASLDANDMILDIGTTFVDKLAQIITDANTIIWNGPVGVFEFDQFANGTKIVANAVANSAGYSVAGGGDTIAAINKFNIFDKIDYVSTAGGALLEFLEGKELPAIKLLQQYS